MWIILLSAIAYISNGQSTFYHSFDVANDFIASNNTFNVRSTIDTNLDETLNISFSFRNGRCWYPKLSLSFEEIDFDSATEYFYVYYPSLSTKNQIANCTGSYLMNCGYYTQCINNYDLLSSINSNNPFFEDGQKIIIYVIKSAAVNAFCNGYSINLNLTISCGSERYHIWNTMTNSNDNVPVSLYGHIIGFYQNTLSVIGGIESIFNGNESNNVYSRSITPYINNNASGDELQFASSSWTVNTLKLPALYTHIGLFCDAQCYTQIDHILYIYGGYNAIDLGQGVLLKYDLSSDQQQFIDSNNYVSMSGLSVNRVCITNNNTNLFIIGGYDGKSTTPWHNIQTYDINKDLWNTSFSSLIEPRIDCGCIVVNNILYIIGGWLRFGKEATDSIEILDLSTMQQELLTVTMDNKRIGHKVLKDKKDRIWMIGGRNINSINIADVEIFNTVNNTMVSTDIPIKYASTLIGADYSAVWYDSNNSIMFASGGYDGIAVTHDIQYLSADIIGTDAYPTPPPTLPPLPTPYPTPMGEFIGLNRTYDMSLYNSTDSLSFTQIIQSTEDTHIDSFFYVNFQFINGMCLNASLTFRFEEIDFAQTTTEYLDIFYPNYPLNNIAHCTGNNDYNCGSWITCIDRMKLQQAPTILNTSDNSYNYIISILKSAEINQRCTYSMNAKVTIHCGPRPDPTPTPTKEPTIEPTTKAPTSLYTNISDTFNLSLFTINDTVSFTIPVQSTIDNYKDSLFFVQFDFINGQCYNPRLTFSFEEIDFADPTEFIEIYGASYPNDYLTRCTGANDFNCGQFVNCLQQYPLQYTETDTLNLILLKSSEVNKRCTYSMNANVTITCGPINIFISPSIAPTSISNTNITCPPTPICTPSPTKIDITTPNPTDTTSAPSKCGDASNTDNNGNNNNNDKLMDYLPWILFGVSAFFNFLLLLGLIQQCRFRKSIEMRQRMALVDDETQMVTMNTRAGYTKYEDFQEITSDASVDYVTMAHS